jgi:hypothetical protein
LRANESALALVADAVREDARMRIPYTRLIAAVAVAFALCAAAPAAANTRAGAMRAARTSANHHTESQFGISGRPRDWNAACLRTFGGRWVCAVVFNGGQCSGSLRLKDRPRNRFRAHAFRIGCGE